MAHFSLGPGETSRAVAHRTVEEIWFFVSGQGEMWRRQGADEQIVEALNIGTRTVERVRQRFVEEGFEAALDPRPRPRIPHKLKEKLKGDVVALAKSDPPKGRKRWTLRLLAGSLVELKGHEKISHESVRRVLKKMA